VHEVDVDGRRQLVRQVQRPCDAHALGGEFEVRDALATRRMPDAHDGEARNTAKAVGEHCERRQKHCEGGG
jgi:hypothetical protein